MHQSFSTLDFSVTAVEAERRALLVGLLGFVVSISKSASSSGPSLSFIFHEENVEEP
jgi:hypothetical protein